MKMDVLFSLFYRMTVTRTVPSVKENTIQFEIEECYYLYRHEHTCTHTHVPIAKRINMHKTKSTLKKTSTSIFC